MNFKDDRRNLQLVTTKANMIIVLQLQHTCMLMIISQVCFFVLYLGVIRSGGSDEPELSR